MVQKQIVVFYYSQTGQALNIAQELCKLPLEKGISVLFKEIRPTTPFPFPWPAESFFQAFPESRLGIPCPLEPFDLSDAQNPALIVLAWQPWYLSPSIPIHAFLQHPDIIHYLRGKRVLSVIGSRNMWFRAFERVRAYISDAGAELVGNISLYDRHSNLVSVATIIRWLIHGKKERGRWLPDAGIAQKDIVAAQRFGVPVLQALETDHWETLRTELNQLGAAHFSPSLVFIEKNGHRIFGVWAKIIIKKGPHGAPERKRLLRAFMYYLFAVIYVASPFGLLFFYLTLPFRFKQIKKQKQQVLGIPG